MNNGKSSGESSGKSSGSHMDRIFGQKAAGKRYDGVLESSRSACKAIFLSLCAGV